MGDGTAALRLGRDSAAGRLWVGGIPGRARSVVRSALARQDRSPPGIRCLARLGAGHRGGSGAGRCLAPSGGISVTPSSAAAPTGHPLLAPDLDPALPGLAARIDPASVADMFRLRWPGGDSGPVIRQCTLEHALWRPGVDCVATYRLDVLGSDGDASTMGAVAISPGSVRHWLYNIDPALPGLASAADPRAVNAWLAAHAGGDPQHYTITPVRYRAGTRCVLRYQPRGGDAPCWYGKVVAGSACAELATIVSSLGDSLVAPYVGVAADWQLVVQRDAGRESLRDAPLDSLDSAAAAFAAAGHLLARLHSRSAPQGPARSLADDVDTLRG